MLLREDINIMPLICLTLLISLTKAWGVTRVAAKVSGKLFLVSWIALAIAVLWMGTLTGEWHYINIL